MAGTATSKKERKTRTPAAGAAVAVTVSQAEIARLAYEYYCARGGQGGDALEDWLRAERELTALSAPAPARRPRKSAGTLN